MPRIALIAVAVVALLAGGWFAQRHYRPAPAQPGAQAALWQLKLPDASGKLQPLSQWRGKILVINFWATWCAPCREEMPDFDALRRQYHSNGVEFVGVAIDNARNVTDFTQKTPVSYPLLIGEGVAHSLTRQLGNPSGALPYTLVLDRDGNIVQSHLGRLPRATLDARLRKLGA